MVDFDNIFSAYVSVQCSSVWKSDTLWYTSFSVEA
jgi:hypothetical protein